MKGRIYENKTGKRAPYIVKFPGVYKRFWNLSEAERFLNMLRYRYDEGTFDERDYKKGQPLGFRSLSDKWLSIRLEQIRCKRNLVAHIRCAQSFFNNQNVKEIRYSDIEDYVLSLPGTLSGKTKANYLATLHAFWTWLIKREEVAITQIQNWPKISYDLGWRNTVDKPTQQAIIEEVKRISYHINPKIWIGIKWLATYVSIRPIEMIHIKEGDFDFGLGVVNVRYNKEDKPKTVPFLNEDLALVKSFPTALPYLYFFRHGTTKGINARNRHRFGKDYLYSWWKRACENLKVKGVDLYGGTRHSSVRALRERFSPEQIRRGTMHHTNQAFERYFQVDLQDAKNIYETTRGAVLGFPPGIHGEKDEKKSSG